MSAPYSNRVLCSSEKDKRNPKTSPIMFTLFSFLLSGFVVTVFELANAQTGYQDSAGFHPVRRK